MASATGLATKSAKPPGGNGTTMVMLRVGQAPCAMAKLATDNNRLAMRADLRFMSYLYATCNDSKIYSKHATMLVFSSTVGKSLSFEHPFSTVFLTQKQIQQ
jgi:hypothetical protein